MGVKHKALQAQLEAHLDTPHAILYTNGHLALENIIAAMALPDGGEVITIPFTFASTTHTIGLYYGCDKIEALISEKTVAIIPVHMYGNLCHVDTVNAIPKKWFEGKLQCCPCL